MINPFNFSNIKTFNTDANSDFIVVLSQYKRNNLKKQLEAVFKQTRLPRSVIVYQNEDHQDISYLINDYPIEIVKSSINTKFFGRFAYCLALDVEYLVIMDDDIIPGKLCFENYLNEAKRLGGIIGGNGRIGKLNRSSDILTFPPDVGVRHKTTLVDFVGHMWVIKKEWLYDMFAIPPITLDTGEDMHLCFSAKLRSGIKSYVCKQIIKDESCDISNNALADDKYATFKVTPNSERVNVESYFLNLGLEFIKKN